MNRVTEQEFKAIKKHLRLSSVRSTARTMQRSESCIMRIKASKDFKEYRLLVVAEHTAKKPRTPLAIRIHNAQIAELLAIRSKGRIGAYKAACLRLEELGV